MSTKPSLVLEYVLLVVLAALWASSYPFIKIALATVTPLTLMAARALLSALLLYTFLRASGLDLPRDKASWLLMWKQASLNFSLAWVVLAWGAQYLDSGTAGVLNSTSPLFVVLIAFCLGQPQTKRERVGSLLGFAGVVVVLGVENLQSLGAQFLPQLAVLFGAFLYAVAVLNGKTLRQYNPRVTATATMLCNAVMLLPLAFLLERPLQLAPSSASALAIVWLAVFGTGIAMIIYFRLLKTLGSLGVASQAYLRAGIAVLLGVVMLGERPSLSVLAGLGLIILGVAMINWRKS